MRILIVSNSNEFNDSLSRYLEHKELSRGNASLYTFEDLRIMPREILEMDFVISEVYRIEDNTIDNYGLDIFLSFLRMGKKGILLHIDSIKNSKTIVQNSASRIQKILFKLPGEMKGLVNKLKNLRSKERTELKKEDVELLKDWFPYRVVKDHHHGRPG
jgi:hypothetical protein